jgi:hypothetical protein
VFETIDARCDDHLFCDGIETCTVTGCASGSSPCGDGVACTDDTCDETSRTCSYTPNPRNCPLSNRCDPVRGCEPRVLAHDDTMLYDIALPSGTLYPVVRIATPLTDIALAEDGTFYGATTRGLVRLDERSGAVSLVLPVAGHFVALDSDPATGALYGATGPRIVRFDLGVGATNVAVLPPGVQASGDIAFIAGRLLLTTTTTGDRRTPDDLYSVPLDASATPLRIGSVGVGCVWGLANYHDTLYGLTCTGDVLVVDPATGASTRVANDGVQFGGAAAR